MMMVMIMLLMIMIETWSRALMEKAWTCLPMIIVVRLIKKMMIEMLMMMVTMVMMTMMAMLMMMMISADAKLLILEEKFGKDWAKQAFS